MNLEKRASDNSKSKMSQNMTTITQQKNQNLDLLRDVLSNKRVEKNHNNNLLNPAII
jgi:hypothetical protein